MKKSLSLVGALALVLCGGSALAQGPGNGPNDGTDTNFYNFDHSYSNHYYYTNSGSGPWYSDMSRWSNAPAPRVWTNSHQVVSPKQQRARHGGPITPDDVQALVEQFQRGREAFMIQQQEMRRQMSSANEQQRQQLRDQLRDQMREWQRQQGQVRQQMSEQADRLREQLRSHDRLIERVSNPGNAPAPGGNGGSGSSARGR